MTSSKSINFQNLESVIADIKSKLKALNIPLYEYVGDDIDDIFHHFRMQVPALVLVHLGTEFKAPEVVSASEFMLVSLTKYGVDITSAVKENRDFIEAIMDALDHQIDDAANLLYIIKAIKTKKIDPGSLILGNQFRISVEDR